MSRDHPYNLAIAAAEQAIEDAKKHRNDLVSKLYPPRMPITVTFPSGDQVPGQIMQTGAGHFRVVMQDGSFVGREGLFSISSITPRSESDAE